MLDLIYAMHDNGSENLPLQECGCERQGHCLASGKALSKEARLHGYHVNSV